ncbi:MAG: hypothetical protein IJ365_04060 [Clostridia bacterium]|nr:hypothetical protein [Clostridia bacterium]
MWSLVDKTTGKELLFKNEAVRPCNLVAVQQLFRHRRSGQNNRRDSEPYIYIQRPYQIQKNTIGQSVIDGVCSFIDYTL